jgi:hypothetical protein
MPEFRDLWQRQELEEMKMSVEELRARASKLQKRIQWRNLREQLASGIVVVWFASMSMKVSATVPRTSFGLIIAGAIYTAVHLYVWGEVRPLPSEPGSQSCIDFYRCELERQRDLLRSIWKWYLGPLIPGLALFVGWGIVTSPPERRWLPELFAFVCVACFWAVARVNSRAARRFDRQIKELTGYGQ